MTTTNLKQLLDDNNPYGIDNIVIPKIQRAYAQGRMDTHAVKTRDRFLKAIHKALETKEGLTLDFVYGNVNKGSLIPLDGQQRLTTLWLLHWYAAKRDGIDDGCLSRFTYNTRYSAREFLKRLIDFRPSGSKALSRQISNQGWFPMDWINDPTVSGMLTMLDEIQARFSDIANLWEKLDMITFYFRSIDEMKLTDEIYIKMNSRGKPLTDFEHFKAELLRVVKASWPDSEAGEAAAKRIGWKIDTVWTEMLWCYRGADNIIDDEFMRYFMMVSHILTYRANRSVTEIARCDNFEILSRLYKGNTGHIEYLERALDVWVEVRDRMLGANPACGQPVREFFEKYLAYEHTSGRVVPLENMKVDVLGSCLRNYPFDHMRPNNLQWLTTLYAFLTYLMHTGEVSDEEFRRRLRIVVNLQKNSSNEVVDTPKGDAGNRMPAILAQVERIILTGEVNPIVEIDGVKAPNFNTAQLIEEQDKLAFTSQHPELANGLFELEDHRLITGRTAVIGYENSNLYRKFINLFDKNRFSYDAIDCAMCGTGDYSQRKNDWSIMVGSGNEDGIGDRAWHTLFHPTEKVEGFDHTRSVLHKLLGRTDADTDNDTLYAIAREYVTECRATSRYDWRYYYINYPSFRAKRYGKYTMSREAPYELVALHSEKKESSNAYQCFLESVRCEEAGDFTDTRRIEYAGGQLSCCNDGFRLHDNDTDETLRRLRIPQQNGIDTVDRLEYLKEHHDCTQWEEYAPEILPDID